MESEKKKNISCHALKLRDLTHPRKIMEQCVSSPSPNSMKYLGQTDCSASPLRNDKSAKLKTVVQTVKTVID